MMLPSEPTWIQSLVDTLLCWTAASIGGGALWILACYIRDLFTTKDDHGPA